MGNGTHLGKVRGLGSSGHGSQHWLQQRLTALGNILLVGFSSSRSSACRSAIMPRCIAGHRTRPSRWR